MNAIVPSPIYSSSMRRLVFNVADRGEMSRGRGKRESEGERETATCSAMEVSTTCSFQPLDQQRVKR